MGILENKDILIEKYIRERKDMDIVANELGVGYNTVVRALKKFGIKKSDRFPSEFTQQQKSLIYGTLLGDGNLTIQPNGVHACLRCEQSIKQKEYLQFKFDILKPWINADKPTVYNRKDYPSIKMTTVAVPLLTDIYHQFYKNGIKKVTKEILDEIDDFALSIWFQDDGTYFRNNRWQNIMRIATHSFDMEENIIVKNWFKLKYNIDVNLAPTNKGKFYLHVLKRSHETLVNIIKPHIHSSMQYKLNSQSG